MRQPVFHLRPLIALVALTFTAPLTTVNAGDWPTYRGDNARSGATDENLDLPLSLSWTHAAPAPPRTAWTSAEGRVIESKLIGHRVKFDDAFHPAVVGKRVYFGSSVDHQLRCADLETGETIWSFYTDGPIRLAPTVAQGRVYFGSDDGFAYCLNADDGELVWKLRAGPADEYLLARGEMISRWPVRTGVLVDDGVAYFGAGIFPHEDVYLLAVNADDGAIVWKQDNISALDAGRNDLSPQGYLLASDELLFVPSGRTLPAAFDRATGRFKHKRVFSWRSTAGGVIGGTRALLADGQLFTSGPHHLLAMDQETGDVGFGWFAGRQMVVKGDEAYVATGSAVARLNRLDYAVNSRRRHELENEIYSLSRQLRSPGDKADELRRKLQDAQEEMRAIAEVGIDWQQPTDDDASLLAAGELVFVGGENRVTAYRASTGEQAWQAEVPGEARGLVVAGGRLLVSTNQGQISVFASGGATLKPQPQLVENPYPQDDLTALYEKAAEEIRQQTGVRRGFCLIAGGERGRLAYELAQRSDLRIYAVEPDPAKVAAARAALSSAGLYGTRIVVHQGDPAALPYSNYFANLITSDTLLLDSSATVPVEALARHLKPLGGKMCLGQPKTATAGSIAAVEKLSEALDDAEATVTRRDGWGVLSRGELPGAGDWSHQYGNAANTAVSPDKRLSGGLGVLWYGDPGPDDMVNRHEGAVGPLSTNGRLFVQSEHAISAFDAYNGVFLWKHENPEALRTGVFQNQNPGNLAASDERLFHFLDDQCYELDAATGKVRAVHRLPESKDDGKHAWGYVAAENGLLFGTATVRKELEARLRRRGRKTDDATDAIFAIDLATGEHLWAHEGDSISHHTIAIGPEHVFFIDSSLTSEERAEILREDKSRLANLTGKERELAEQRAKRADVRRAVALDARSGKQLWTTAVDVTDCSEIGIGGGKLSMMYHDEVLILGGANANGHYWRQFVAGDFSRRRLVALSANDGYKLWAKDANYRHRPIILGGEVIAEPWSYDLHTGAQKTRVHPLTGEEVPWSIMRTGHHCGMLTGSDSGMLMFRSGYTGFYDLSSDSGTRHFAGHRLGCWINAIPANGLVLIPEASAGCVCLFSIASTIALEPREPRRPWTIYSAVGAQTPVKSMALNLGAPGDRKDARGKLWLSYPRYRAYQETSLDVSLDLEPQFAPGGGFESIGETAVEDVETPWLYTSWADGIRQLELPLLGDGDEPATYEVRLYLANADGRESTFNVSLQGQTVLENYTPDQPRIETFEGVLVEDNLTIELTAVDGTPLLNAIEVVRSE